MNLDKFKIPVVQCENITQSDYDFIRSESKRLLAKGYESVLIGGPSPFAKDSNEIFLLIREYDENDYDILFARENLTLRKARITLDEFFSDVPYTKKRGRIIEYYGRT